LNKIFPKQKRNRVLKQLTIDRSNEEILDPSKDADRKNCVKRESKGQLCSVKEGRKMSFFLLFLSAKKRDRVYLLFIIPLEERKRK